MIIIYFNSHYLTYTFLFLKVERMYFLNLGMAGLKFVFVSLQLLWFSSGGTKSVLHTDSADNILCLIRGKKDFFLVDKKYAKQVRVKNCDCELCGAMCNYLSPVWSDTRIILRVGESSGCVDIFMEVL